MILHMRCECGGRIVTSVADRTLERLLIIVRLHVDLEMIAAEENFQLASLYSYERVRRVRRIATQSRRDNNLIRHLGQR